MSDYVLFLNALTNQGTSPNGVRILSPASVDLMRTDHLTESMGDDFSWEQLAGYGFGLGVRTHISKIAELDRRIRLERRCRMSGYYRSDFAVDRHVCRAFAKQSGVLRASSFEKYRIRLPLKSADVHKRGTAVPDCRPLF